MPSFTVTPEPSHVPPRVRLDFDTQVAGSVFTSIAVKRNGVAIRAIPPVGSQVSVAYDYDTPFGVPQTYTVEAQIADSGVADWTESWASLAAWTGDTASWSVAAGVASSAVFNAAITRTVSSTIGRVDVTNPRLVRLELLDAGGTVVCSVECGDNKITLFGGAGYSQVIGSGTFTLIVNSGTATVNGTGWTVSRTFTGTPVKVRIVGLVGALQTASWSTTGGPRGVALDGSGNVYVVDNDNKLIRKYNSSGTQTASWSTTGPPGGIAINGSNVYVTDLTGNLIRKYTSAGAAGSPASWSTTGTPWAVATDGSGNVYVADYGLKLIRKYTSAGAAGSPASWSTTGTPLGVAVDGSGNVYVTDNDNNLVRKYNSSGTQTASWSTTGSPRGLAVDSSGNVYVADYDNNLVRKYNSSGTQTASWSTTGSPVGVAVDGSGNVYVTDTTNFALHKYQQASGSIGQTVARLLPGSTDFNGTDTDTLNATEAWLIHPIIPDLSVCISTLSEGGRLDRIYVDHDAGKTVTYKVQRTIFAPQGRPRQVPVTYGPRRPGEWSMVLRTPRAVDRDAIISLLADGSPVLLRVPPSFPWDLEDGWYDVDDNDSDRVIDTPTKNPRTFTLPLTPIDEPPLIQGAQWTWSDVLANYDTWSDVLAAYNNWLDLLVGPTS